MSSLVTKTTMNTTISSNNTASTGSSVRCHLLSLPAELRNRIWTMVTNGDSHIINMSSLGKKARLNLTSRRNLLVACKQINQEADLMFFANNTFVFKAKDRTVNYGGLDNVAEWLGHLNGKQRDLIGKIIICTNKQLGMLNWSWVCAGYCDMTFGFEIGERIDSEVSAETEDGEFGSEGFKPWGEKEGHKCKKTHYLLVKK